jgi:hypothetical protein
MLSTCALLIALAAAAEPTANLVQLPAESPRAFQCRSIHVPEGRACQARCDVAAPPKSAATSNRDCRIACTRRALHQMAACRDAAAEPAGRALASR